MRTFPANSNALFQSVSQAPLRGDDGRAIREQFATQGSQGLGAFVRPFRVVASPRTCAARSRHANHSVGACIGCLAAHAFAVGAHGRRNCMNPRRAGVVGAGVVPALQEGCRVLKVLPLPRQQVRPNRSFETTTTGIAAWPRSVQVYLPPRGQAAMPASASQLQR